MRPASADLVKVIEDGSFSRQLVVDVLQGAERRLERIGCTQWDLTWDLEARLKSGGKLTIVDSTDDGTSLAPKSESDPLAPYGQDVSLRMEVSAGDFSETVQIGFFRIAATPAASDQLADYGGDVIVTSSTIDLTIEDRLGKVDRRGFRTEENPASTSAWDEAARISGMQVARNIADATIPADLVYKAVRGGRLDGVKALATALGGREYTTPDGLLAVSPDVADDPVTTLRRGADGTILGDTGGMDSTEVYNVVVGTYETAEREPIFVVAIAGEAGFEDLAHLSPDLVGENTFYRTNSSVQTQGDAEADVAATLYNVARQARRVTIQCILNPLVETGDVVWAEQKVGAPLLVRLVTIKYGASGGMTLTADVLPSGEG